MMPLVWLTQVRMVVRQVYFPISIDAIEEFTLRLHHLTFASLVLPVVR
jgi:hypothetical protein